MENMAAKSSGCRDETGESALRRYFSAWRDSSNDLISVSMDFCKHLREFAWLGFIENLKWNGVRVVRCRACRSTVERSRDPGLHRTSRILKLN